MTSYDISVCPLCQPKIAIYFVQSLIFQKERRENNIVSNKQFFIESYKTKLTKKFKTMYFEPSWEHNDCSFVLPHKL